MKPPAAWNHWGVRPGQTWAHECLVLLVLREVRRERFECLVLQNDLDGPPASWGPGSTVELTAYSVQAQAELIGEAPR